MCKKSCNYKMFLYIVSIISNSSYEKMTKTEELNRDEKLLQKFAKEYYLAHWHYPSYVTIGNFLPFSYWKIHSLVTRIKLKWKLKSWTWRTRKHYATEAFMETHKPISRDVVEFKNKVVNVNITKTLKTIALIVVCLVIWYAISFI